MKFEDDFLFAKPVKSGFLASADRNVYWLNGKANEHSTLTKMLGNPKTTQEAWEKVVYTFACDEKGDYLYRGKVSMSDFHLSVDRVLARNYGMLIYGIKDDEEEVSLFDGEVAEEVKNSKKASAATIN